MKTYRDGVCSVCQRRIRDGVFYSKESGGFVVRDHPAAGVNIDVRDPLWVDEFYAGEFIVCEGSDLEPEVLDP